MKEYGLAVDGGGTFLKAALFSGQRMEKDTFFKVKACSDGRAEQIQEAFVSLGKEAKRLAKEHGGTVREAGIAMPGPFDYRSGVSQMDHKFAAIKGKAIAPWLREELYDIPVFFGHDSTAFFRGGLLLSGLEGCRRSCGVTLGTGLGFAARIDGRILQNAQGGPGISLWNHPYREANAEHYASRRAVIRFYEERGGDPGKDVYEISLLARAGDLAALAAFAELGGHLGRILQEVIAENGFEVLLLGGAIAKSADLLLPELCRVLKELERPPAVRAIERIDEAPLYGAAVLCGQGDGKEEEWL